VDPNVWPPRVVKRRCLTSRHQLQRGVRPARQRAGCCHRGRPRGTAQRRREMGVSLSMRESLRHLRAAVRFCNATAASNTTPVVREMSAPSPPRRWPFLDAVSDPLLPGLTFIHGALMVCFFIPTARGSMNPQPSTRSRSVRRSSLSLQKHSPILARFRHRHRSDPGELTMRGASRETRRADLRDPRSRLWHRQSKTRMLGASRAGGRAAGGVSCMHRSSSSMAWFRARFRGLLAADAQSRPSTRDVGCCRLTMPWTEVGNALVLDQVAAACLE